jgi:hypothetical protein
MAFQSHKFRELARRRKAGEDWDTILAEVFGYARVESPVRNQPLVSNNFFNLYVGPIYFDYTTYIRKKDDVIKYVYQK